MPIVFSSFPSEIIDSLANKIKEKEWDKDLPALYKWPLREQLSKLKKVCGEIPKLHTKWLDDLCDTPADSENNEPTFAMTLELREQMPAMLKASNADEMGEIGAVRDIKTWIVRDWGGIQLRHEQSEDRLSDCIKQAVIQDASAVKLHGRNKSGKKEFSFERVASWSKYLAFKFPQRCAIYDARVIFSLNWLLLEIKNAALEQKKSKIGDEGKFKFFPFLEGQNSVMGLLNYDIHLLLSHYQEDVLLKALDDDINYRNNKGGKSRLRSSLEKGLFIRDQEAYSEYCVLLSKLAAIIYPDDEHGLTKIEMILFSIADKAIAEMVMSSLTGIHRMYGDENLTNVARGHVATTIRSKGDDDNLEGIDIPVEVRTSNGEYSEGLIQARDKFDVVQSVAKIKKFLEMNSDLRFGEVDTSNARWTTISLEINGLRLVVGKNNSSGDKFWIEIQPASNRKADKEQLVELCKHNDNEFEAKDKGRYAKLLGYGNGLTSPETVLAHTLKYHTELSGSST